MLIIKKQNYTWFIHDNWVMFFSAFLTYIIIKIKTKSLSNITNEEFKRNGIKTPSFQLKTGVLSSLLMYLILVIFSKIRLKQQQKKKVNQHETNNNTNLFSNVRGGENILDCIETDGVYEVQKDSLMITIRRVLKITKNKVPFFIEPSVLFLAYVINLKRKNLLLLHGVYGIDLLITDVVQIALKSGIGIGLMIFLIALQPILMIPNLGAVGLGSLLSFVLLTSNDFKCDDYFYKLPQFIDGTSYIERPVISNEKIYVKGYQDLQIMKLDKIPLQTCTNDPEHIDMNKFVEIIIQRLGPIMGKLQSGSNLNLNQKTEIRTCVSNKRNYVKLEHRTKTLDDVKVENDSTNMEQVTPLIHTFEEHSKKMRQPIRLETEQE